MPDSGDDIVIRTSGLTKRYGPETGVFDLDLLIRRGRSTASSVRTGPERAPPCGCWWG